MTVTYKAVVDCHDLEEAVKLQFGLGEEFDLLRAFFETAERGSYQSLCFDEDSLVEAHKALEYCEKYNYPHYKIEQARHMMLVLTYLHDVFPNEDTILVYIDW